MRYACALAERFNAELHLLHIFEQTPEPDVAVLPPDEATYSRGGVEAVLAGVIPEEWEERCFWISGKAAQVRRDWMPT